MLLRGWTGCLGFLAFAVSNAVGWVYLQNTTAFQGNATFPSYDYEDFVEPFYDLTGLLLPVTITSGCNLTVPLPPLASLNVKHEYNTTMLVLERRNMLLSDCHTYQSIFVQAPQVLHTIKDLGYPPVQVLLLSALLNSDENFGNSKDEYFYDFEATRPPNIHLALVGRDTGQLLWTLAQDTGPVPIRVVQDPGFWNRFRRSPLELAHIVFRYILFVPLIMTCAYYVFTIIWSTRHLFDTRILVLACAAYFALGSIVAPVGEGKERYADVIRYTSWITLYTCYYWMVFKWLLIIKRVQYPRGIIVFMVFTGLCASIMLLYSLLHVILLFHENIIINVIKRITIVYCFPPIVALQGIAMITYGFIFLRYVYRGFIVESLKSALAKLTRLCYCTFASLLLISVCSMLNQNRLTSQVPVMVLRAGLFNVAAFLMTCMIIWALKVHDSPEMTPITTGTYVYGMSGSYKTSIGDNATAQAGPHASLHKLTLNLSSVRTLHFSLPSRHSTHSTQLPASAAGPESQAEEPTSASAHRPGLQV